MPNITIFTDGSARGNPGPGGWGAVVVGELVTELGGREDHTTNNRMELSACIKALEFVSTLPTTNLPLITIYTDSSYVLNGITKWVRGWENNGWKTSTKSPVLNADLWRALLQATKGKEVKWNLIKGHAGVPGNERCDVIATSFADKAHVDLYIGNLDKYPVSLEITTDTSNAKSDSKSKSKSGRAYSYVSMVDNVIKTYRDWSSCERDVNGQKGAKFKKVFSKSEEEKLVKEWENL